jgi:hypothetical protein
LTKPHPSGIIENRLTKPQIYLKDLGNLECQSELINQKFVAACACMASGNECQLLVGGR